MLMARVLSALKVQVDVIVSSPLKRALQTAQFVGTELGYDAKVEISPALRPEADYLAFQQLLEKYADRRRRADRGTQSQSCSSSSAESSPAMAEPASACARALSRASIWSAIRPVCSGLSIRAWRAGSMRVWRKAPAQRPRGSRPPLCAATIARVRRQSGPARNSR